MDRRLLVFLLLFIVIVAGAGAWRLDFLQARQADSGPQALSRDGHGGFFLATARTLFHLDGSGALRARHEAASLGLRALDALALGEDGVLFIHDGEQRRLFRCDMERSACAPFASSALGLGRHVQLAWLYGPDRRLLVADTLHHRLLALDANGTALPGTTAGWHAPGQVAASGEHVWLADSATGRIVTLDATGTAQVGVALQARGHPLRFIRRHTEWWVVEAALQQPRRVLRYYRPGVAADLALPMTDPAAVLDTGQQFLVAAQQEWRLVALDPYTGAASPFGSDALRAELSARRASIEAARAEQQWLPAAMAGLLLPAVAGVLLLLWRARTARRSTPAEAASANGPRGVVRIDASAGTPLRQRNAHLLLGPDKIVLVVAGKPVWAAPYRDLKMDDTTLLIGRHRLPLAAGRGDARQRLWPVASLRQALVARLGGAVPVPPPRRVALLPVTAALALLVLLVLLLKLWHTGLDSPGLLAGRLFP